jgi:hypothetical protein
VYKSLGSADKELPLSVDKFNNKNIPNDILMDSVAVAEINNVNESLEYGRDYRRT